MKLVLVIGGTGAQGAPVVKALSQSSRYEVRVLTRNTSSPRAQALAALPNVTLIEGSQDNQQDLHRAFKNVHSAWVNTDGFTIGEKNELFYGIRAYEIARHEGVQHYIYASTDYALKDANWDERYHWGHNDAKGRVGEFIMAQGQGGMRSSLLVTGPYVDMLWDGMFVPKEEEVDGERGFVWRNPAKNGKIPLIALEDVGMFSLWLFDNPADSSGMTLKVATDEVSFEDIAKIFTRVTGKKGRHEYQSPEEYLPAAEPFPNAPSNWAAGPSAHTDESTMTWRENFGAWWRYWGEGVCERRDFKLLDRIYPGRVKSLEAWMLKVGYDGKPRSVLKGVEDLKRAAEEMGKGSTS